MTLLSITLLTLAGWPIRRAIDPDAGGARAAGESFLFGSGSAALVLFLMAACGIAWSRVSLLIGLGILAATAAAVTSRPAAIARETAPTPSGSRLWLLLDLATVVLVVAHVAFAALERPYEWDYFGIWGYKAHLFFETRSIPWPILRDAEYARIQRGHPLFAPLLYSVGAIVKGDWQDRDLGLLITAFGVALILVVRGLVSEEHPSRFRRCLTTLAVAPGALSLWIGLAEGPLIAFGTSGILLIRRGLRHDSDRSIAAGAVLLGCAAMTKNEGTGLILAAAAALLVSSRNGWKRVFWLWPAAAVLAPWIISGRLVQIQTDFLSGDLAAWKERLLGAAAIIRELLATPVNDRFFWWAAVAAILMAWRRALTAERFLLVVLLVQFSFDVLQNFLVSWDPAPHIRYSWNRVLDQIGPLTAFTAATLLGGNFGTGSNRHPERL